MLTFTPEQRRRFAEDIDGDYRPKTRKTIVLVGLMGSGKTALGKRLAVALGRTFVDSDTIIEEEENLKISEIFCKFGEKHFRLIEKEIIFFKINECLRQNVKAIISLGGGAFENEKTRKFLLNNSKVIWLSADVKILIKRLGNAFNRPMIKGNVEAKIEMLLNRRTKNYEKSHLKIDTDGLSIDDLCDKIIKGIS